MPYDRKPDEELLADEIRTKNLSNIYIIYGNDSYLKQYYCEKLISLSYSGDPFFNYQKFGNDCGMQEVYDAVNQFPMMSDSKCVVVDDFDIFACSKEEFDRLCRLVGEIEQGCVLIIKFDCVDFSQKKDSRVVRLTKEVQKAKGKIYNISRRSRQRLIAMLVSGAKKRGLTLSERDAGYIVDTVGDELSILQNELEKLCFYRKSGIISREDIENVCITDMSASVYDYVGAITDRELSKALKLLDKMFFMRVEPFVILYNITSVYVDMYRALAAKKSGRVKSDIMKDFAYPDNVHFKIDRANRYIAKYDSVKIEKSFDRLMKTDRLLKTFGADPRQLLEQTTVELAAILRR